MSESAQLPPLYSAAEFAARYPVASFDEDTWGYWLRKWREEQKLMQGIHWLFAHREGLRPARVYKERPVLRLLYTEAASRYFGQQVILFHGHTIVKILAIPTTPTSPATLPPSPYKR